MSTPRNTPYSDETPAQAAMSELVSAESALNMEPHPMPDQTGRGYLTDTDEMVAHAYEHIRAAIEILRTIP